jgi:hypothetical protein
MQERYDMGWHFAGFFVQAERPLLDAALRTWPGCRGRLISDPFHGIGVAVPEHALTYGDTEEDQEQAQELTWALEQELVAWSHHYPTMRFVFIRADCFAGVCDYEGYMCQDGVILERAKDGERSGAALSQLARALGVELDDSLHFAPFTRRFFDHPRGPSGPIASCPEAK